MSTTVFCPRQELTVCGFHVSRDMDNYILLDHAISVKVFSGQFMLDSEIWLCYIRFGARFLTAGFLCFDVLVIGVDL